MPLRNIIGEFLYKLKPVVDTSAWHKATGDISNMVSKTHVKFADYQQSLKSLESTKDEITLTEKKIEYLNKLAEKGDTSALKLLGSTESGKKSGYLAKLEELLESEKLQKTETKMMEELLEPNEVSAEKLHKIIEKLSFVFVGASKEVSNFVGLLKQGIESTKKLLKDASTYSNSLGIKSSSIFYDSEQRDLMTRYGMSSSQAAASSAVTDILGYDLSSFGIWTQGQKEAYNELMNTYQKGINGIDTEKLENYYDLMQKYQLNVAKYKIELQSSFVKLFAESNSLKNLVGSAERFMDASVKFLNTPAVQWFFDTFIDFLSGIVDVASGIIELVSWGKSSSNSTPKVNNINNKFYVYGNDYSNTETMAKSIALKSEQALGG